MKNLILLSLLFCLRVWGSIEEMTLEEKVGQLLIVHFNGTENNAESTRLIREGHVGGFIYYNWANELSSPEQVQKLSSSLQQSAKIPLFIAVDQEGGRVNRLTNGFTLFPSNNELGMTKRPDLAEQTAYAMGQELHAVGVNLNFAPVVDVNTNATNPVIGTRSYGSDPDLVATFAARALVGFKSAGVIATLKHFPGHGDVSVDSHVALPVVHQSLQELMDSPLIPFRRLAAEAPVIMTAHLLVPVLDPMVPVTFSQKVVEGLLRNQMNFQGVIITDSLVMQGLLSFCPSVKEAALKALQAGHDIVLLGGKQLMDSAQGFELSVQDVIEIHHYLVDAVKTGKIPEERINLSVERILQLKRELQNPK